MEKRMEETEGVESKKISIPDLKAVVLNAQLPLSERFRALFSLRNRGGTESIDALIEGFQGDPSALLRHEIAFVLGQMQNRYAITFLKAVLADTTENSMVRHEAGEALGAIGDPDVIPFLQQYQKDPLPEVAETCEIAIDRIKWWTDEKNRRKAEDNPSLHESVDPAPPAYKDQPVSTLREKLLDTKRPLFSRYRAMFALREIGNEEAVKALVEGLKSDSALMRHEIAYVLGQLSKDHAIDGLVETLDNPDEHPMVRHEAAEALGAIGTKETRPALEKHKEDTERVVRESCFISLDIADYVSDNTSFEYAKTK